MENQPFTRGEKWKISAKKTYRLITGAIQIIGAIWEQLEIGREEFISKDGVNVDEELLENRDDLSGSVVVQAAMAGKMAILAIPVVTAAIGECMRGNKGKEQYGEDGHEMHGRAARQVYFAGGAILGADWRAGLKLFNETGSFHHSVHDKGEGCDEILMQRWSNPWLRLFRPILDHM